MFFHYIINMIVGILIGFVITRIWVGMHMTWGYIAVDQTTQQVRLHLNPADFKNGKVKKIVLTVTYDEKIPIKENDETRE